MKNYPVTYVQSVEDFEYILECFEDMEFIGFGGDIKKRRAFAEKQVENGYVLAVYHEGAPIGFLSFYSNDMVTKRAYVTALAVDENLGLLKGLVLFSLLESGVKTAMDCGMENVRIEVAKDNVTARNLYENLGFSYLPEERNQNVYMETMFKDLWERIHKRKGR